MVEKTDRQSIEDYQPQNQHEESEGIKTVRKNLSEALTESTKGVNERVDSIADLKKNVSLKLIDSCKINEEIKTMFKEFSLREDKKLNGIPALFKSHDFYFQFLQIDSIGMLAALDEEMKQWEDQITCMRQDMNQQIAEMKSIFQRSLSKIQNFEVRPQKQRVLEEAVKSMRKLPVIGHMLDAYNEHYFEWPSQIQVLEMPTDGPIKLSKIQYKVWSNCAFSGIQMHLSNGEKSPLFVSQRTEDQPLKTIDIAEGKNVAKITGRVLDTNTQAAHNAIYSVKFIDGDNNEAVNIHLNGSGTEQTRALEAGEEVIGCYGQKQGSCDICLFSLGFIVWKPPKLI